MTRIRWVCMSDLHLGALNSVLTSVTTDGMGVDRQNASSTVSALARCLGALAARQDEPPELVVLGDLFELALTTTDTAAAAFGQFVAALEVGSDEAVVAPRIRFVPGNHDHRLWTRARDAHYVDQLRAATGDDTALPDAGHTTALFPERDASPVRDGFVELLAARALPDAKLVVEQSYPNLGMVSPDGRKAVVLSHGHFVEPLYRLMSNLDAAFGLNRAAEVPEAWHLEADNGGWIDFFWSSTGDSGDVSGIVRNLYESLQSPESMAVEVVAVKDFVARQHPGPRGWLESRLVARALAAEVGRRLQRERHRKGTTLSPQASAGLAAFLSGPVRAQLGELATCRTTFVFGHTHKPFADTRTIAGFPEPVTVVNTGGWVVDSIEPDPLKGAAVILVDEDANVAVLRFYTEGTDPAGFRLQITSGDPEADNPLLSELASAIDPDRDPWRALGEVLATVVPLRGRQLGERLAAETSSLRQANRDAKVPDVG